MSDAPEKLPSKSFKLTRTIEIIEALKGGFERRATWSEVRRLIDLISEEYFIPGFHLPTNLTIYRARILVGADRFSNLNELVAPDPKAIKAYGRCNRPNMSVFYGALNLETVFSELGVAAGDRVQIIECRIKQADKIKSTVVGEIDHVRRYGKNSSITSPEYAEAIRKFWGSLDELSRLRVNLADAFIADRFRQEVKYGFQYKITSAFSDILFELGLDAFFYPSVGHLGGWNIAIKKEVADRDIEIFRTTVHEVYDAAGYGIVGHTCVYDSSVFDEGGKIAYDEKKPLFAFKSFDELVYFWSRNRAPHRIAILAVIQKPITSSMTDSDFKLPADAPPDAEPQSFSTGIDASIPVTVDLDFSKIRSFMDQNQPNWTAIIAEVVPDEGHEVGIRHLRERMERDNGFGLPLISKDETITYLARVERRPN